MIIDDDKLTGFLADNSEMAALMNQLRSQNETLLRLNRTKDRFFSIISHDLRTPLVNVNGYSNELKYSVEKLVEKIKAIELTEKDKDNISSIVKEGGGEK